MLAYRRELADRYTRAIAEIVGLVPPYVPDYANPNYQSYAVTVLPSYAPTPTPSPSPCGPNGPKNGRGESVTRDVLMQRLLDNGVSSRRGIMNADQEAAYVNEPCRPLPTSEFARDNVILLPLFHDMTVADQDRVLELLVQGRIVQ